MRSKRIIGFSLLFVMVFLLIGLNTACASNIDDLDYNLSDSLESSPVSNAIDLDNDGASDASESNPIQSMRAAYPIWMIPLKKYQMRIHNQNPRLEMVKSQYTL